VLGAAPVCLWAQADTLVVSSPDNDWLVMAGDLLKVRGGLVRTADRLSVPMVESGVVLTGPANVPSATLVLNKHPQLCGHGAGPVPLAGRWRARVPPDGCVHGIGHAGGAAEGGGGVPQL
jgi:hypothetical protein